jgi:hypothetical protein
VRNLKTYLQVVKVAAKKDVDYRWENEGYLTTVGRVLKDDRRERGKRGD